MWQYPLTLMADVWLFACSHSNQVENIIDFSSAGAAHERCSPLLTRPLSAFNGPPETDPAGEAARRCHSKTTANVTKSPASFPLQLAPLATSRFHLLPSQAEVNGSINRTLEKKKAEELIDQARPTKLVAVLDGGSGPWQRRTARITKIE